MMSRISSIALAVIADTLRRKIVYILLVFGALLAFAIPSLPDYGLGVEQAVFKEFALALVYVTALVLALTLAAIRIPAEIERRTVYNVLAKNVGRWEYVVGTWAGVMGVVGGAIAAFTAIVQAVAYLTYGDLMWVLWQATFAIFCEMGVLTAFAIAVSALIGPVVVVVATIAVLFVGHAPGALLGGEGALANAPLTPSLEAFNIVNPVAHGSGVPLVYLAAMLVVFAGFAGAALLAGAWLLARRDL